MSKKKTKAPVDETIVEVAPIVETPTVEVVAETKIEKRGRPIVPGCARQEKIAKLNAKIEAGLFAGRGRPTDPNSARAQRIAATEAKKAAGLEIKRGRPKMDKPTTDIAVELPTAEVVETAQLVEA